MLLAGAIRQEQTLSNTLLTNSDSLLVKHTFDKTDSKNQKKMKNEITCPNCQKSFQIDESGFANILKQVRDKEFSEEVEKRLQLAEKEKANALELAESKLKSTFQDALADKERQLIEQKAQNATALADQMSQKDKEIQELKSAISKFEVESKLAITTAVQAIEKERDDLANKVSNKELEKQNLEVSLKQDFERQIQIKDSIIQMKEDEIARVKDMKLKLSTKMVGESLEQHCENEFNRWRPSAFRNAYFEKDNDASSGTKGDFIFKEFDDDGNEVISIMFEMKNENDETTTKKRNEDFFGKLDKDRTEKKCEYAVLVSLLEPDNEFYNNGIADVTHKFDKMYVIRPQFFIPIISFLRNAALSALKYKQELALMRNQNIDIANFEDKINKFRDGFAKNYFSASDHFQKAIQEIDKSIARMEQVKRELTTTENQLRLANQKTEELTIRKLTYNNPTMKAMFDEAQIIEDQNNEI